MAASACIPAPVFAVILYHGERPWPLPTILGPAYRLPPDMASIGLLDFSYTLVDLGAIPDAGIYPMIPSCRPACWS